MPTNAQEQFFKDIEPKSFEFDAPAAEPEVEPEKEEPEEDAEEFRNRRERRLAAKLQAEREAGIQMAARLEALSEVKKLQEETSGDDYLKNIEHIYGTDSPEAKVATDILQRSFKAAEDRATKRALELLRKEQEEAANRVKQAEASLDSMVDDLEDSYNVDLTSRNGTKTRKEFFEMLERFSPKDKQGNITEYADHHAVWEMFQAKHKKTDSTAKQLAARSMTQGSPAASTSVSDDATVRWMHENGII